MGGCCSSDAAPDVPQDIKMDPGMNPITIQSAAFGTFGGSRDFGVWENTRPADSGDQKKQMWLWFNKSDLGPNRVRIDLENFRRGHNAEQPDKGKVLFYATMNEKPSFEYFQRAAGSGRDSFFGFFGSSTYLEPEDIYYTNHIQHVRRLRNNATTLGHVITKWSTSAQVQFFDGDTGRGADIMQKDPVVMEIYAKGTNVTTYQRWVEHSDNGPDTRYGSVTTELVDRIEYRLTFKEALWGEFFVEGDAASNQPADPTIESPFFSTTLQGGWFARTVFTTKTKPDVDPALAILIAHVCATEFSVAQMKKDMAIPVPSRYPETSGLLGNGLAGISLIFKNAQQPKQQWTYAGQTRV